MMKKPQTSSDPHELSKVEVKQLLDRVSNTLLKAHLPFIVVMARAPANCSMVSNIYKQDAVKLLQQAMASLVREAIQKQQPLCDGELGEPFTEQEACDLWDRTENVQAQLAAELTADQAAQMFVMTLGRMAAMKPDFTDVASAWAHLLQHYLPFFGIGFDAQRHATEKEAHKTEGLQ